MYTKQFWLDTGERVVSTMAQTLIALLTVDSAGAPLDAKSIASAVVVAGVVSLLKCLVASRTGASDSASLIGSKVEGR